MNNNIQKENINHICEVCGNQKLIPVLNLGKHPMCDDLVPFGTERVCNEYTIEIIFCDLCNTAHQHFQVPKEELFPITYHYRSRFTKDVLDGMKNLVESYIKHFGNLDGKMVLDIGCNDGSLLDFFKIKGALTFGVEPTAAHLESSDKGHKTYNDYLSKNIAYDFVDKYGHPDLITFTNVFAHIENLKDVLNSIRVLINKNTVIVIENHYLGSILDGNQFDTFYHEHPRTYSYSSFVNIAASLNLKILRVEFPSRYGGNIRIYMGNFIMLPNPSVDINSLLIRERNFLNGFDILNRNINRWVDSKKALLNSLFQQYGKLRAKAFPGRAAILVKLLDLDSNIISTVFEKPGSLKIGHFLPGTRIPIKSDADLFALNDQSLPIINLAWHIPVEIHEYLNSNGYVGNIINIISSDDFIE